MKIAEILAFIFISLRLKCASGLIHSIQQRFKLRAKQINAIEDEKNDKFLVIDKRSDSTLSTDATGMNIKKSTRADLISNVALISGTAVGAGVLALPAFTRNAGVLPSSIALLFSWCIMAVTGLLISEVVLTLFKNRRMDIETNLGLLSISRLTLGNTAGIGVGAIYLFLHYALLVAYVVEGGHILSDAIGQSVSVGQISFVASIGALLVLGSEQLIGRANSVIAAITLASFLLLLAVGIPSVQLENLAHQDASYVWQTVPVMLLALVYHNVVPVVCKNLAYDAPMIRSAILLGSGIPLGMFLLWNAVVLGTDSAFTGPTAELFDPVTSFAASVHTDNTLLGMGIGVGGLVATVSSAAIATSFIGFALGLQDFYKDLWPKLRDKDFLM